MKVFEVTRAHHLQIEGRVVGNEKFLYVDLWNESGLEHELRVVVTASRARAVYSYAGRLLATLGEEYPKGTRQFAHALGSEGVAIAIWMVEKPDEGLGMVLTPEDARAAARELLRLADEHERIKKEESEKCSSD